MTSSFAFVLTVPCEARFVPIVRDLTQQAVTQAEMNGEQGAAFVTRVVAATERALDRPAPSADCEIRFACAEGELRVEIGGETLRHHSAAA